jgi:hypothetical protein
MKINFTNQSYIHHTTGKQMVENTDEFAIDIKNSFTD